MITHHRARTAGSPPPVGSGSQRRSTSLRHQCRQRYQRYFPERHTAGGGLNFTAPGNRPSLTNCAHARVGNVEDLHGDAHRNLDESARVKYDWTQGQKGAQAPNVGPV